MKDLSHTWPLRGLRVGVAVAAREGIGAVAGMPFCAYSTRRQCCKSRGPP